MNILRKISFGYFIVLLGAAALNYIPGLTDDQGLAFGIFALDLFDDALHLASAIWALTAAFISRRASQIFLIIFALFELPLQPAWNFCTTVFRESKKILEVS